MRPEIQALRAAAVSMVVVYHLWPEALPGGYAGVDVFFVISGFLITSHLLKDAIRTGRVDLGRFWARRARRLLPASLLVVLVSAVATWAVVPVTFWRDWFSQMAGAVLYVLNWQLAGDSIDYLAAENNASPVQHYWSLSVEEQFYVLWPLVILLGIWIARKRLDRKSVIAVLLGGITLASLGYSIVLTISDPAQAYFVTPTRAWEFGLGGLLALIAVAPPVRLRAVLGWAGMAGIVATSLTYTASTPFPGYTALLPVLSTAAVIWAGVTPERWSLAQIARFRPIQYTGDISYSLYLWHWPLIVLAPYVLREQVSQPGLWLLLVISIVLAAVTKRYVEEPGRSLPMLTSRRPRFTALITVGAMAIALVVPAGGFLSARAQTADGKQAVEQVLHDVPPCLGAAAMVDPTCGRQALGENLYPSIAALKTDNGIAYDCYNDVPGSEIVETCTYGSTRPDATRVAITGDSHAAMLVAGLASVADQHNWTIDTYVGRNCIWATPEFEPEYVACRTALQDALEAGGYDTIITTGRSRPDEFTEAENLALSSARAAAWTRAVDQGTRVIGIIDNPLLPENMTDCVIEHPREAVEGTDCLVGFDQAMRQFDTTTAAAEMEPRAGLIDVGDLYCRDQMCPMVIGNVTVYRDRHHLTNTYVTTAAPIIAQRLAVAMGDDPQ
ncbi:acyltransferase [Herbiconiux sp. VKM Ac-1786]|uniref:acyltransferase family protein n=1 Tax=Herbiconiux sp. VKM Ac-1786 TaxID=2783824 RepID=UPI00188C0DF7|nr:acyltransferase [Herbiconiux sp. VKM Ac-1786]